jgi:endonuclease-3
MKHIVAADKIMDKQEQAWEIYYRLLDLYGEPDWRPDRSAVDELILTILSANTNDVNSGRAFDELTRRYNHDWDVIRTTPLDDIKDAIRVAGMYNQKAPRIVTALERIKAERGAYNLDHLPGMPVDEAMAYLTDFPGVGHKTASIVLLFVFNMPAFPVDTHIQRIAQRTGISSRRATPEKVKADWEALLPGETFFRLHVSLITHGREKCRARKPQCDGCPLLSICDYGNQAEEWAI